MHKTNHLSQSLSRINCIKSTAQKLEIQCEETQTIKQCKEQAVKTNQALGESEFLVFVYKGKVLLDEQTVKEAEITEDGFVVVMSKKTKKAAELVASSAAVASDERGKERVVPAATAAVAVAEASSDERGAGGGGGGSGLLVGQELEKAIEELQSMGFPRDQCVQALRAAFNNPDRAVEYLLNGIPENMMVPDGGQAAAAAAAAAPRPAARTSDPVPSTTATADADGSAPLNLFSQGIPAANGANQGVEGESTLGFLRENPQFQAIRAMVQGQPSILQPMLGELQRQNPQLYHLINSNQEEFLQLLNEPSDYDDMGADEDAEQVALTQEEHDACERLTALGFTMQQCVEAYLACDKNEEMAANFLFENQQDAIMQ